LRYLLLVAALLTPRPPQLLVLNEPETSLHPELLPALGRLVATASSGRRPSSSPTAPRLRDGIADGVADAGLTPPGGLPRGRGATDRPVLVEHELLKQTGMTAVAGQGRLDAPAWHWPSR
jgi:hypothetical protein